MSLFKSLFTADLQRECPRCMGKGYVDQADIQRLDMELKWLPGDCAYCGGSGKVPSGMESKVPVNMTYLSALISPRERKRLLSGHPDALKRSREFDHKLEAFIAQIVTLHFVQGLQPAGIADSLMINYGGPEYEKERQDFLNFIGLVIQKHSPERD